MKRIEIVIAVIGKNGTSVARSALLLEEGHGYRISDWPRIIGDSARLAGERALFGAPQPTSRQNGGR